VKGLQRQTAMTASAESLPCWWLLPATVMGSNESTPGSVATHSQVTGATSIAGEPRQVGRGEPRQAIAGEPRQVAPTGFADYGRMGSGLVRGGGRKRRAPRSPTQDRDALETKSPVRGATRLPLDASELTGSQSTCRCPSRQGISYGAPLWCWQRTASVLN
jgi:hypothetical protein